MTDELNSLKRVNYFLGQLLGVDDFRAEQEYLITKHRLHNRALHGWGVVSGLGVRVTPGDGSTDSVHVEPGFALDCLGDEIVVPRTAAQPLPADGALLYVCLQLAERESDFVPAAGAGDVAPPNASRIEEAVLLMLEATDLAAANHSTSGHGAQHPCGTRHPVVIARLRRGPRGWRRDTRYRATRARTP